MFLTQQTGFLGPFAYVLGKLFEIIYNILADENGIASLGVCIIIFTIVVKIILFPLTFKQQKSSKINMMIQPEMQKIQKKYKDKKDQASMMKQQQEMQDLYDKYGTSMTGGCLGMLIQLPVIYALYRVIQKIPAYVSHVYDMYQPIAQGVFDAKGADKVYDFLNKFVTDNTVTGASYSMSQLKKVVEAGTTLDVDYVVDAISNFGVTHLHELAQTLNLNVNNCIDNIETIYTFCGINISDAPGFHLGLPLLIPLLSGLFQYLSMKVSMSKNTDSGDSSQAMMKSMSFTMPALSFVMCITLPSFIGIYWATSAAVSMVTQLIVNAYYDHVDMDELLEKQMEKAAKKKKKGKKSFMQRMLDSSEQMQEEMEKMQAMKENSSRSLKNYVVSEEGQKAVQNNKNKKYKEGSIGSKANIMLNYNNQKDKEN